MDKTIAISLCMGSSCFARGNNSLLPALEALIRDNHWQDRVALSGSRCENCCSSGPNIVIDGHRHSGLDSTAIAGILAELLADANSAAPAAEDI